MDVTLYSVHTHFLLPENLKELDTGEDGRIILKWMLKKVGV
jgi:hypothetical protein